ncbi:WG repeat-containing protein [Paenibacillus turpanensis]|uniref:WG repeat-containing protein n=1 Tax=Paenibacillus turpanensis TaxID=2689078 RepID=UPI00140C9B0B|nr:WG repeat-containing protein [Paenibacillus turpanensis]
MNRKRKIMIPAVTILVTTLLFGCGQENSIPKLSEENSRNSNGTAVIPEDKNQDKIQEKTEIQAVQAMPSLAEQGYKIELMQTLKDGTTILTLRKQSDYALAMLDENLNWILKPTPNLKVLREELGSNDGLLEVALLNTDPLTKSGYKWVWGFMNTKGEWVAEPQYGKVWGYSDGKAVVQTIETDRDDRSNARIIAIDESGKEVIQLIGKTERSKVLDELHEGGLQYQYGYLGIIQGEFKGNRNKEFVITKSGVYDTKGTFHDLTPLSISWVSPDGLFAVENRKPNGDLINTEFYDLTGKVVKTIEGELTILTDERYILHPLNSKRFQLTDRNGTVLLEGDKYSVVSEDNMLVQDGEAIALFDFNGSKIADSTLTTLWDGLKEFSNGVAFKEGNEYFTLINAEGKVLMDESYKLTDNSKVLSQSVGPLKAMRQRVITDTSNEFIDVLVNTKTQKIIPFEEIMNMKIQ